MACSHSVPSASSGSRRRNRSENCCKTLSDFQTLRVHIPRICTFKTFTMLFISMFGKVFRKYFETMGKHWYALKALDFVFRSVVDDVSVYQIEFAVEPICDQILIVIHWQLVLFFFKGFPQWRVSGYNALWAN